MTSAEGISLASRILQGNLEAAAALLIMLDSFFNARGDPLEESMASEVKRFVYSKTEHSERAMEQFISEAGKDSSHLAA